MIDLSIGITAHAESITLHKTLLSIQRAARALDDKSISFEVILQLDNPSKATISYSERLNDVIKLPITIQSSAFGDPGLARNDIIKSAKGRYITFIDGDDLMSENWLVNGYTALKGKESNDHPSNYVAHTELSVEFGDVDSIVIKQGEINQAADSLLSVYANRWNVAIMIRRDFLIEHPYPTSSKGFGFEDWYINCLTIYNGLHNILVPQTALFIRRKLTNSVWLEQKSNYHVLRKNPLLSFKNIRSLPSGIFAEKVASTIQPNQFKLQAKKLLTRNQYAERILRKVYSIAQKRLQPVQTRDLPSWIRQEWQRQHDIDKNLFPNLRPDFYETITLEHYQAATAYKTIIDSLSADSYDYVLFVPWVMKGGADLFSINYANSIAKLNPSKHVLVIATTPVDSPWKNRLLPEVDFVEFGLSTKNMYPSVKTRVMEQLIENSGATHLHIINSEFAYDFISSHSDYITASRKKIVITSFSQSTDKSGRIFGYSHTHVPSVYDLASLVTTDNQAVANMWISEYGFEPSRIRVHNQPVHIPKQQGVENRPNQDLVKILWAARLSPEKQPELVVSIAKILLDTNIHIDLYGQVDDGFKTDFLKQLPKNVTYRGSFDGFSTLNPTIYDAYLYTSLFDGMPNSVLEAGSYGLPVIASAVGGLPELIDHEKNGLLVYDIKDAQGYANQLRRLVADRGYGIKIGQSLRKKIETEFSESAHKESIEEMLKEIKYL